MKKVKHILATFLHSYIPQHHYYPKLLHTRFLFSLKYYISFIIVLASIFTGIVVYQYSPLRVINLKKELVSTLSSFPADALITLKSGNLDTNQNKPMFLWVYTEAQPLFVFMIHPKGTLNTSYTPLPIVFLGGDRITVSYKGRTFQKPYDFTLNMEITRETIREFLPLVEMAFPSLLFAFYITLFIVLPLFIIGMSTVFILLSSGLVFMLLKTFIPHIHIKKCIQAGLHGTHIPLIITVLFYSLFPTASNIPVVSFSLIFVFSLVATYEMYSKEVIQIKGR